MPGQHDMFLDRLWDGEAAEYVVEHYLRHSGYGVYRYPFRAARNAAEHDEYADDGDMFAYRQFDVPKRVEVRGRKLIFTDQFPYETIFISNVDPVARADADPSMWRWYIVNTQLTHAAMIDHRKTRKHWIRRTIEPRNTGNVECGWVIDRGLAEYVSLEVKP